MISLKYFSVVFIVASFVLGPDEAKSSTQLSVEKICAEEFQKTRIWRNFIEWGNHPFLSPGECDPYISDDKFTWIGGKPEDSVGTRVRLKDYEECYAAFHNPKPYTFGSPTIKTWSDAIKHSTSGNNTKPEVDALKELCRSFVSEDHLTWTAPSPEQLNATPSETNSTDTLSEADAISVELEFWQSVKDSDNADMLRAYLEHYPNGKFKSLAKIKIKQLTAGEEKATTASTSMSEESINKIIDLSGYWELEHTIESSAGAVEPYTLIVQLEQDGNLVSSVTVVELQTSESISCNASGGSFEVNGAINSDAFTGTIRSANLDGRFSLTGDHKELKGTYNSRWLSGICAGEMSGSVTARRLSDDVIRQLTSSIGNNTADESSESTSKPIGSKAGMSQIEKDCHELFRRQNKAIWRNDWGQFDFDISRCDEFVSVDGSTWIGSDSSAQASAGQESESNSNEAQDSVQPSSTASTVAISRRQWCVTSSGVSNRPYAECLKKSGIPTRGQAGAIVDRASSYFREWKKNKAFAISTDSIGDSGSWKSGGDAIKRSLLNCYIYSSVPSSCRVVNVNGRYEEHFDEQRARDSAFGANGSVDSLVGTYYFEMNYQGIDGTLRVKMSGGSISAKLETCIEGICADWTLKQNPYTRGGRRLTGTMKRGAKSAGWTTKEVFFQASFSKDTNRIVGTFGFYEFEGKKRSSN